MVQLVQLVRQVGGYLDTGADADIEAESVRLRLAERIQQTTLLEELQTRQVASFPIIGLSTLPSPQVADQIRMLHREFKAPIFFTLNLSISHCLT